VNCEANGMVASLSFSDGWADVLAMLLTSLASRSTLTHGSQTSCVAAIARHSNTGRGRIP